MQCSPGLIKTVHALLFVIFDTLLAIFGYERFIGRITVFSILGVGLFVAEAIIPAANGCKCPLTEHAESPGSASGWVNDISLSSRVTDRAFEIYGILFAAMILLLVLRLPD
jgi:hypothetical protein